MTAAVAHAKRIVWHAVVNRLAASPALPPTWRPRLYRRVGIAVGPGTNLQPSIFFQSRRASIGRETFVNRYVRFFNGLSAVTLGDRVDVGMGVTFATETHEPGPADRRCGPVVSRPIVVGDGCWIGANATVLAGVTVGAGCVVGAGAVVTRDCDPHGLYVGVPARRVRDLPGPTS